MKNVVAIDGPAASGKSTLARGLAQSLGFASLNSGAFYRAVSWWLLQKFGASCTAEQAAEALHGASVRSFFRNNDAVVEIDGLDPWPHLREDAVNAVCSPFSQFDAMRDLLNREFHKLADERPIVTEGRDMGTVVFPDAKWKIYLESSPEERARRRAADGEVDDLTARDKRDSTRARAPLTAALDAIKIDNSTLSPEQTLEVVVAIIRGE